MFRKATFKPFYEFVHEPGSRLPSPEFRALRSVQVISFVHDWRGAFLRWLSAGFIATVLTLALLVVVGAMSRPSYPGIPSLPLGASLQASGSKAQGKALTVPAVSGPQAPDPKDRAVWAAQPGWTAADLATARSSSLRPPATPMQPSQRGQYAISTVLSGLKPILTTTPAPGAAWAVTAIVLLALVMMAQAVARRPVATQAEGAKPQPAPRATPATRRNARPQQMLQRAPGVLPWSVVLRARLIDDLLAAWERTRLVPT